MRGNGDHLDFLDWRNLLSYLLGMGVESLAGLSLAAIGLLLSAACLYLSW